MPRSWTYEEMEREVRKLAHSFPPSDFGSTRAIQAITHFVFQKLREAGAGRQDTLSAESKRLRALTDNVN